MLNKLAHFALENLHAHPRTPPMPRSFYRRLQVCHFSSSPGGCAKHTEHMHLVSPQYSPMCQSTRATLTNGQDGGPSTSFCIRVYACTKTNSLEITLNRIRFDTVALK